MKKIFILALALVLVLSLASCGVKDKVQNSVKEAVSGSQGGGLNGSASDAGEVTDDDWEAMQDWAHGLGWDGEGYHFPQVDSMREWPAATVWTELGLPDMTPDKMEEGEIYNDGNVHVDGYADVFVAECRTDEASFYALADKLWGAGIKGVNPGSGHIIPALEQEWLHEDDPNYLWYRAYYEHMGNVMEVYLQYTNGWDDKLWVGVVFAPSDPNFEHLPKISWPASEIKTLTGVDLPNPGGTVYGNIDMGEYRSVELVIEDTSQADYDRYLQNLRSGSLPVLEDEYGSAWDFYGIYGQEFYPENYEKYPAYINVNYAYGVLFIAVNEI